MTLASKNPLAFLQILILAAACLSGCTKDFAAKRVAPGSGVVGEAQTGMPDGSSPHAASMVTEAWRVLAATSDGNPRPATRQARCRATETLVELYGPALLDARAHTLTVRSSDGRTLRLRLRRGTGSNGLDPRCFVALEPADHFVVETDAPLVRIPGIGVPLVGTRRAVSPVSVPGAAPAYPVSGFTWAVTAVPRLHPGSAEHGCTATLDLELYDPHPALGAWRSELTMPPLAADYTTPAAVALAHFASQRRGLRGFLSGTGNDFASAGIYTYQPPDPDKIPVVLVHGLISDAAAFRLLQNNLENDPEVRRRFQFCFFYYPSSLPVPYSAMLLREDLQEFVRRLDPYGTHPAMHRVVLVGHSMGGLLCRMAVSDGGDTYYHHFFRRPLEQLGLTSDQRQLVRRAFYYRASPDVSHVVFIATPHRGSGLAGGLLGNLGRLLVRLPLAVRSSVEAILSNNQEAMMPGVGTKTGSSMNSLTPGKPLVAAVNDMRIRPGVATHSVIGDRGRHGSLERSSDGVVPYMSSHFSQAQSEIVVPAGHSGTLARRETAVEVDRVLMQAAAHGRARTD